MIEYFQYKCSKKTDIQSAGMVVHFILTLGLHSHGESIEEIIKNINEGRVILRTLDSIVSDLLLWMLSHKPEQRPTALEVLR